MNRKSSLLYLSASLLLALPFTYFYFLYTNEYPQGSFERMANFEADKVFQTRLLITTIANALEPCLPALRFAFQWAIPYPIGYEVLLQLLNALFLTILLGIMPLLLSCLNCRVNNWICLLVMVPITWNYLIINGYIDGAGLYYPYDIPSMTFFAGGVILFLQKKWLWFYLIFILACLNRETACFITLGGFLLALQIGKKSNLVTIVLSNKRMLTHVLAQAGIWLAIRLLLSYAFRNNPGEFFEKPHSMFDFIAKIWSGEAHWAMNNPRLFLTLFAGTWIIPLLYWKNLNQSAKRLCVLGVVYLLALVLRSNMMETRVYNELNVIVTICAICAISPKLSITKST